MRQIFLDTETTGLEPDKGDRIVEIGCIEMVNRRLTGQTRHFYFNPERPGNPEATKVHGLTDEFLADKPLFASVAEELLAWLAGAELLMHNAPFDVGFVNAEFKRLGRAPLHTVAERITDTLALAREAFPGKANSLDALCRRLEVDNTHRTVHGALLDAGLLAEVYIRMTRGQDALGIHLDAAAADHFDAGAADFGAYDLPVIEPDAHELAAHMAVLAEIDKASCGRTVWQSAVA